MRAKVAARCPNCRRLQARVEALEAELAALKEVVARLGQQLAAARKDSSTSAKPPLLRPRQAAQAATTEGPGSTPNRRAARTSQTRTRRVPTRSPQRRVLRSSDRLLPRVRARPAA